MEDDDIKRHVERVQHVVNHSDQRRGAGLKGQWLEAKESAVNEYVKKREERQLRRMEDAFLAYMRATDAYIAELEARTLRRKKAC